MKRIRPNVDAIKARLEANKENSRRRESIPIEDNPIMKVEGPGTYNFRATYYPHSEDPAAEPFPTRHYHFGIPGTGILYCPQENDGEDCALCDFVWDRMKESKGQTEKVKRWASKLPKARVWIPGKIRTREEEGVKFFSFGTAKDRMSKNHEKLFNWFFNKKTEDWLSPEATRKGGFDMEIEYEKYDASKAKMLNTEFGLADINLDRDESEFGGDFEEFMATIPNIDTNDLPILKSYTTRTTDDAYIALKEWLERLSSKNKKESYSSSTTNEGWRHSSGKHTETTEETEAKPESKMSDLEKRLASMNIQVTK